MKAWTWLRYALRTWRRRERRQVSLPATGARAVVPVFVEGSVAARGFQ
jgi:hypothetical protein